MNEYLKNNTYRISKTKDDVINVALSVVKSELPFLRGISTLEAEKRVNEILDSLELYIENDGECNYIYLRNIISKYINSNAKLNKKHLDNILRYVMELEEEPTDLQIQFLETISNLSTYELNQLSAFLENDFYMFLSSDAKVLKCSSVPNSSITTSEFWGVSNSTINSLERNGLINKLGDGNRYGSNQLDFSGITITDYGKQFFKEFYQRDFIDELRISRNDYAILYENAFGIEKSDEKYETFFKKYDKHRQLATIIRKTLDEEILESEVIKEYNIIISNINKCNKLLVELVDEYEIDRNTLKRIDGAEQIYNKHKK